MLPDKPVLFGVAGWSYPDWKGIVYPANCKDTLRAVAARVDLIEINSTFYGLPSAKNCSSWVQRTADLGTVFTAKLPQEFTHQGARDRELIDKTAAGFAPLLASGRCLGLLAQFNYQFEFGAEARAHLAVLADAFGRDTQLFVEVRHRSWNSPAAIAALQDLGLGITALDYPGERSGFALDVPDARGVAGVTYFRLHGRNQAWFRKGAGRDQVYDWEYSADEVTEIEGRIERLRAAAVRTAVVANNHFHGKALRLIEQLLAWYRDRPSG